MLASHPMIVGLKDATGDLERVAALRAINGGKDFLLFSGEDDQGCDFVRLGEFLCGVVVLWGSVVLCCVCFCYVCAVYSFFF
jgi:4-hydroxy-tetrahydrodipicolinate synthase